MMQSLYKQFYRYTHPRAYRHNENLWPYIKIARAGSGEINSLIVNNKKIPIIPLSSLKNAFSGRILLSATGPSVNNLNFDLIPPMPCMGVNGAYHLQENLNFEFYIIVDMSFFDHRAELIGKIIKNEKIHLFTTVHGFLKLQKIYGLDSVKCKLIPVEDINFKIFEKKTNTSDAYLKSHKNVIFDKDNREIAFNCDARTGIVDAATVIYWALQIIPFLGFKEIYIIGLDMNKFNAPRFYENKKNKLPTTLDENLYNQIIPALDHASRIFQEKGITVLNLSPESAIPDSIFKKENGNEFFSKK